MTQNEATIVSGLVGGVLGCSATLLASWFTSRNSPNYHEQIESLAEGLRQQSASLQAILQRQSENTKEIQDTLYRTPRVPSAPTARIDSTVPNEMYLVLKSEREFFLSSVALLGPNKAVIANISPGDKVSSTGFRVRLPQSENVKVWNNFVGIRETVSAYIRYRVRFEDGEVEDDLPILMTQGMYSANSVTTMYIKLDG